MQAYSVPQIFNLSILPGTAFRREAESLGLAYQPRPPYYVVRTPTLDAERMYELMEEAQDALGIEFDAPPPPRIDFDAEKDQPPRGCRIDLDVFDSADDAIHAIPTTTAVSFSLWLRSSDFHRHQNMATACIERLLTLNPHLTLDVLLEPMADPTRLTANTLESLLAACYRMPTYLDRYYSLQPGRLLGAKRLTVLLPHGLQTSLSEVWREQTAERAQLARRDGATLQLDE
jgi:hypothetical protein